MRILVILINILSGLGMLSSIPFMIEGSKPCASDGCLIRLSLIFGLVIFIPSLIVFAITFKKSWRDDKQNKS